MVSPSRLVDIENRRGIYLHHPVLLKNQVLPKELATPLVDVRNTLGTARNISKNPAEVSKNDFKLKPPTLAPIVSVNINQKEEVQDLEWKHSVTWDAPLSYSEVVEDTYGDIIPLSLQLTDDDISCLALNKSGPRTGIPLCSRNDADTVPFMPEIDFNFLYKHDLEEECAACVHGYLECDESIPPVPHLFDFQDSFCQGY